jgi:hypothetical protein
MLPVRRPIGMESLRHIDFHVSVSRPMQPTTCRAPLALSLVLARSGSMGGQKSTRHVARRYQFLID